MTENEKHVMIFKVFSVIWMYLGAFAGSLVYLGLIDSNSSKTRRVMTFLVGFLSAVFLAPPLCELLEMWFEMRLSDHMKGAVMFLTSATAMTFMPIILHVVKKYGADTISNFLKLRPSTDNTEER